MIKGTLAKRAVKRIPFHRELNRDAIWDWLYLAEEECSEIEFFTEDCGELLEQLLGDEDDAYEFRVAFSDLSADLETFRQELVEEWVPECFDLFFAAVGSRGEVGYYGEGERDFVPLSLFLLSREQETLREKLSRMTKKETFDAYTQCLRVALSYMSLRARYESLKGAMDIIRDSNASLIKEVKKIVSHYDVMVEKYEGLFSSWEYDEGWEEFDRAIAHLPQEVFIM